MKIAMMTNNYKPFVGGVPVSIERLAEGLRALGNQVTVFAPTYPGQEEEDGVLRYRSMKKRLSGDVVLPNFLDKNIAKAFQQESFDLIHVHHPMMIGYTALYLGRKHNIPVVFTYHTRYEQYLHYLKPFQRLEESSAAQSNLFLRDFERVLLQYSKEDLLPAHNRLFTNHCSTVFAPTPTMKDYLRAQGTLSRIEVLPTGLAPEEYQACPEEAARLRRTYGGGKTHLFCTVSRLEKEKNLDFMLLGLFQYKQVYGGDFRLLVIGDGTQRQDLEDMANTLGLQDNVTFVGRVPHEKLKAYYQACDLFLFTSKSETQGIVLLEGMAAALPVVALEATGVCDVVVNGENGYMCPEDTRFWAGHIQKALADPASYERMRAAALSTALSYTVEAVAEKAQDCYLNTIRYYRQARRKPVTYGKQLSYLSNK